MFNVKKCLLTTKALLQAVTKMKSSEMANVPPKEVFKSIVEGQAVLRVTTDKVFYNPVQEFNRDLSIAVLSIFIEDFKNRDLSPNDKVSHRTIDDIDWVEQEKPKDITILEALSATGLRSIRYAKEVVGITKIIANDISEEAVDTIRENVALNNVDHIVQTSRDDACLLMYNHKQRFNRFAVVDLDPYGSPTRFLDAAVQSVADGGLLLVTATDMAVLAGNSPETCYNKYGAISVRTKTCHEMALRILLKTIESHANRYSRYIVPMLSISADFYIRVFVKLYSGAIECKKTLSKISMIYHCMGCDTMTLHPLGVVKISPTAHNPSYLTCYPPPGPPVCEHCEHCNQRHQIGGPIWSAPIHDKSFASRVLNLVQEAPEKFATSKRMEGVLSVVCEELSDAPLYYTLNRLCSSVHCEMIPMLVFRSAILNAGYEVSYSHANKLSIKTNAPSKLMWDIVRTWVTLQPVKAAKVEANIVTKNILSKPITYEVNLSERDDANPASRREKQSRFQVNPTSHWGPGSRSTINTSEGILKSVTNQNKKKNGRNYPKRQLSPPEELESCKKSFTRQLFINTTSDPDSDADTEPGVSDTSLGTEECNANVSHDESKDDNGTAEPGQSNNGATQSGVAEGISETPTDDKQ